MNECMYFQNMNPANNCPNTNLRRNWRRKLERSKKKIRRLNRKLQVIKERKETNAKNIKRKSLIHNFLTDDLQDSNISKVLQIQEHTRSLSHDAHTPCSLTALCHIQINTSRNTALDWPEDNMMNNAAHTVKVMKQAVSKYTTVIEAQVKDEIYRTKLMFRKFKSKARSLKRRKRCRKYLKPEMAKNTGQSNIASETEEQSMIGSENSEQRIISSETDEQSIIGSENSEQSIIGSENSEQSIIASETHEQSIIGSENSEQRIIASETDEQSIIGSETDEQSIIASETNGQSSITAETIKHSRHDDVNDFLLKNINQNSNMVGRYRITDKMLLN